VPNDTGEVLLAAGLGEWIWRNGYRYAKAEAILTEDVMYNITVWLWSITILHVVAKYYA
jgi:hypothetical protein